MKVGDFVLFQLTRIEAQGLVKASLYTQGVGKGKIQEETTLHGEPAFKVKTPYGMVIVGVAYCELLPKKNNCKE